MKQAVNIVHWRPARLKKAASTSSRPGTVFAKILNLSAEKSLKGETSGFLFQSENITSEKNPSEKGKNAQKSHNVKKRKRHFGHDLLTETIPQKHGEINCQGKSHNAPTPTNCKFLSLLIIKNANCFKTTFVQ